MPIYVAIGAGQVDASTTLDEEVLRWATTHQRRQLARSFNAEKSQMIFGSSGGSIVNLSIYVQVSWPSEALQTIPAGALTRNHSPMSSSSLCFLFGQRAGDSAIAPPTHHQGTARLKPALCFSGLHKCLEGYPRMKEKL